MQSTGIPNYVPATPPLRDNDRFAIWSQQMEAELDDLSHRWNGEIKVYSDREKKYVWEEGKDVDAVMNKAGVNYLITSMRMFCNKSNTLTSYTRDEAKNVALERTLSLCKTLVLQKDKYNLQHQHLEDIGATVMQLFMATAMRAVGNGERNFLSITGIESTVRHWLGQEKKPEAKVW